MWTGEGWQRTQRQLGVLGLIVAFVLDAGFGVSVSFTVFSAILWLLGADVLAEALGRLKR